MIKRKKKSEEEIESNKVAIKRRNEFFETIWRKREHKCEVTGVKLLNPINSMYFHHILPKSSIPEAEFDEENIILLHPDIHANVEMSKYRYDLINLRRDRLRHKYNI